jgi:tetratricopeptide (TPR) repeat protein
VLSPVLDNGFVDYDDDTHVTANPQVLRGLTLDGALRALTATDTANWFPLTRLSHMADVSLYGLDPRGHHLTSLLLHAANTALLFLVLRSYTGALWRPALAAALFGLHPLHVEPVAWAAERKELLAFFFVALTLAAYRRHAARPGPARLAVVALLLALALMAKPVAVTVPVLLLLLDWWPLARLRGPSALPALARLAVEKAPLAALSAACGALTLLAQSRSGATTMTDLPFAVRASNAVVSYARYLGKTVWPDRLSFFYPHPEALWPAGTAGAALLLAAAVSLAAWRARRLQPWVGAGWLWYLAALLPMIGLVQAGWQAMADRYAYLPLVGVFVATVWAAAALAAGRGRACRAALAALSVGVLAALGLQARAQAAVWRSSATLYGHAVAIDPDNWLARQNLGSALVAAGNAAAALPHLEAAVRLRPRHANAWYNLGGARYALRDYGAAVAAFERAVSLEAGYADGWVNLGAAYFSLGRLAESAAASERALALDPGLEPAARNRDAARKLLEAMRRR